MSSIPQIRTTTGEGRPRLIVRKPQSFWTRVYSATYDSTSVTEATGSAKSITSSNAGTDQLAITGHGFLVGDRIRIAGHTGSTPDVNGDWTVQQVVSVDAIKIGVDFTVGGTGGTATKIPSYFRLRAGMRVVVSGVRSGKPNLEIYGRIVSVDSTAFKLTVAQWVGGTPTNGDDYSVNGWVIDLPYCQDIVQTFNPRQTVHELWRGRLAAKFLGYKYSCLLDYGEWISADTLYLMRQALNPGELDELVVVPYVDKPGYNYAVIFDGPMSLSLFGIGGGHEGFKIALRGKNLVSMPLLAEGYGFNYGYTYGTGK